MRAAVIGCGVAGRAHALTIGRYPDTTLVACHDVHDAAAIALSTQYGGVACPTVAGVVAERPDIVVVATGPTTQPGVVADLLAASFRGALLCEKPLAASLGAARDLLGRADEAGVVVGVNQQRRFGLGAVEARRRLGTIGDLLAIEGYAPDAALLDWGPHVVDLAVHFAAAPVRWVDAELDTSRTRRHAGLTLEYGARLRWRHDGGLPGTLTCGPDIADQPLLRLVGTAGALELGALSDLAGRPAGHRAALRGRIGDGEWVEIDVGESVQSSRQWLRSLDELVTAIRDGRHPTNHGGRGLAALEICIAGYLAARTGSPRELPLAEDVDIATLFRPRVEA